MEPPIALLGCSCADGIRLPNAAVRRISVEPHCPAPGVQLCSLTGSMKAFRTFRGGALEHPAKRHDGPLWDHVTRRGQAARGACEFDLLSGQKHLHKREVAGLADRLPHSSGREEQPANDMSEEIDARAPNR